MFKTLQYYWNAARGYRFKPWKSPYMRWRFETFLGKEAANLTAGKFFHLAWKYRDHMPRLKLEHIPSKSLNDSRVPLRREV